MTHKGWIKRVIFIAIFLLMFFSESSHASAVPLSLKQSNVNVLVNGKSINFEVFEVAGNNYFKLRDIAFVVTGTSKQFDIGWDAEKNAINLIAGQPYKNVGGELSLGTNEYKNAFVNNSIIYKDGKNVSIDAYTIGGNNFFKLRDIAQALDIGIGWDGPTSTISIIPKESYIIPANQTVMGNTSGNIINGGNMVSLGDYLFYTNSNDKNHIYRYDPKSGESILVVKDSSMFLNIVGNKLIYSNMLDDFKIYSVNVDGTNSKRINNEKARSIATDGNWLYYINNYLSTPGKLIRMKLDGSEKTELGSNIKEYVIKEDWIFYTDGSYKLNKMKIDKTQRETLSSRSVMAVDANEGRVFYVESNTNFSQGYTLYNADYDGNDRIKLYSGNIATINVSKDWVYFIVDLSKLYKIKTDGSNLTLLASDALFEIQTIGDKVFYSYYTILSDPDDYGGEMWPEGVKSVSSDGKKPILFYSID